MALLFFLSMLFLGVFLLLLLHSQPLGLGVELAGLVCMEGSSISGSRAVSISEAMVLAVCTRFLITCTENSFYGKLTGFLSCSLFAPEIGGAQGFEQVVLESLHTLSWCVAGGLFRSLGCLGISPLLL